MHVFPIGKCLLNYPEMSRSAHRKLTGELNPACIVSQIHISFFWKCQHQVEKKLDLFVRLVIISYSDLHVIFRGTEFSRNLRFS